MKLLRAVAAVVVGYVVSQGLNVAFVLFWHVGERSASLPVLAALTIVFVLVVGLAAGYGTARLGDPYGQRAAFVLAALIALVTVGNIIADVAIEPLWHKLLVLFVMAPAVAVAARVR